MNGAALLVDIATPDQVPSAVRDLRDAVVVACAGHDRPQDLAAGISTLCARAADIPRGLREANEVTGCVARLAGDGVRVLSAYDLGAGRLLVGNSDTEALDRLVRDVLGPLLGGGDDTATLLATAHAFCEAGHSVRLAALNLDVHENTIRKRLARVQALTNLDLVGDSADQMSAHTALLVLRLRGHDALPGFAAS
jgi:DNA-binding PucR family transcriptional regulator